MDSPDQLREDVRKALRDRVGATSRRTWHLDAMYGGGRMFLIFDGNELVGKWPPERVKALREAGLFVLPFMADSDDDSARWRRVALADLKDVEHAVELALESLAFVHTPEGAPRKRSTRAHR